jgi:hypothetical protein
MHMNCSMMVVRRPSLEDGPGANSIGAEGAGILSMECCKHCFLGTMKPDRQFRAVGSWMYMVIEVEG